MSYQHRFIDDRPCQLPVGKVVCVGRNYSAHAQELNNPIPANPLLFIKPATSLVALTPGFAIPQHQGSVHHELEVALLIGTQLTHATSAQAIPAIAGISLALDLTLRDLQDKLKANGHPWEQAKAFDGACPIGPFLAPTQWQELHNMPFQLIKNGHITQQGNTRDMLFPIAELLAIMSQSFTLLPGDVVLTGTPAGVGPLHSGDSLHCTLATSLTLTTHVH